MRATIEFDELIIATMRQDFSVVSKAKVTDVPDYVIVVTIQGWVERANDPQFYRSAKLRHENAGHPEKVKVTFVGRSTAHEQQLYYIRVIISFALQLQKLANTIKWGHNTDTIRFQAVLSQFLLAKVRIT